MEKELGYSQMRFNYITDYANQISEEATRMEMAWQNRKNFNSEVDLEKWLEGQRRDINDMMTTLNQYLEPIEAYMNKGE
ncbi:hypothetical protein [Vagococcus fluvialis]|uniref:hypothetical protein n=1 Tax=Vagococcus fluvialis TaxID=2738 RepID=UPI001D09FDC5|nr:hypothetical protein [Vagococcus fluvialis]UDM79585.1 hypothetical protein K5K97_12970 [Vagococcus fluvialis]